MFKVDTIIQFPGHIFSKIIIYSACVAQSRCGIFLKYSNRTRIENLFSKCKLHHLNQHFHDSNKGLVVCAAFFKSLNRLVSRFLSLRTFTSRQRIRKRWQEGEQSERDLVFPFPVVASSHLVKKECYFARPCYPIFLLSQRL